MTKKQRQGQTITQNAHVVVDIHEAMERWMKVMGIGPFFFMEKIRMVLDGLRGEYVCRQF